MPNFNVLNRQEWAELKARMRKTRDFQKSKLYKWGWSLPTKSLNQYECTALIEKIWSDYRNDCPPTVYFPPYGKKAHGWRNAITLPPWAKENITVIHEVAHSLMDKPDIAWHGSEFVGIMMELLINYANFDPLWLKASVELAGLRFI